MYKIITKNNENFDPRINKSDELPFIKNHLIKEASKNIDSEYSDQIMQAIIKKIQNSNLVQQFVTLKIQSLKMDYQLIGVVIWMKVETERVIFIICILVKKYT